MKRIFGLLTIAALLLPSTVQARKWTLRECTQYALDHNISLKQSEVHVGQREVDLSTARASRLPSLSANASESFNFGRGLNADNIYVNSNKTNTSLSLSTDMTLFNGLRINNSIEMSRLNLEAATRDLEKARDDIRVAVAQAYVQVLYNQEIYGVAQRQVEIDSMQVVRLEEMQKNGKASASQVASQKATLAKSRLSEVQADNSLKLSILDLTQLLELTEPENFDVVIPDVDMIPESLLTSVEDIYMQAIGIKPVVLSEESRLAYAEKNIAYAKGGYSPSLYLNGGLNTGYYTSSLMPSDKFFNQLSSNFGQYVGLSLSIPIFSRLSTRNNVRSAKLSYNQQQLQLENVKKQLYKEIQQAFFNALASQSKYEGSIAAERSAQEAFSLMQAKYENGKASLTEFNESKGQYLEAASNLAQARYEYLYMTKLLDFYRGEEIDL